MTQDILIENEHGTNTERTRNEHGMSAELTRKRRKADGRRLEWRRSRAAWMPYLRTTSEPLTEIPHTLPE